MGTNKRIVEDEGVMTTLSYRSQLSGWGNLPTRHSLAKLLVSEKIDVKKTWDGVGVGSYGKCTYE